MTALLCASMAMGCNGCAEENTDSIQPAETENKISVFSAEFFLSDRWTATGGHNFFFEIKTDDNGVLTAYENHCGISHTADSRLTEKLQDIITIHNLHNLNGKNSPAPGLSPEYQHCSLLAEYTRGDTLQFTVRNDPRAIWAEEMYALFARWFADKGIPALYPAPEASLPLTVRIKYTDGNMQYSWQTVNNENTPSLKKTVYDTAERKTVNSRTIPLPDDYLRTTGEIIASYGILMKYDFSRYDHYAKDYGNHSRGYYGMGTAADRAETDSSFSFSLYILYDSGRSVDISTARPGEIEGMQPFITRLTEYSDSVF